MSGLNDITSEDLRAMLREHAVVIAPGEVLVVTVPHWWAPADCRDLQDALSVQMIEYGIPVMVTPGNAMGIAAMPPDPFPAAQRAGFTASRYGALAYEVNRLLDKGAALDLEETRGHIEDGSLFTWLQEQFSDSDLSMLDAAARAAILAEFGGYSRLGKTRKYYLVERNGLALLVAYCVEAMLHAAG